MLVKIRNGEAENNKVEFETLIKEREESEMKKSCCEVKEN